MNCLNRVQMADQPPQVNDHIVLTEQVSRVSLAGQDLLSAHWQSASSLNSVLLLTCQIWHLVLRDSKSHVIWWPLDWKVLCFERFIYLHQNKSCYRSECCVILQEKWDSGCHLVMRIKLLNDAGVMTESPPSQHEHIFDLSQVIRSVGVELITQKGNWFKWPLCRFHSIPAVFLLYFAPTWCSNGGRLSGVSSEVKQVSSSLFMISAWDWTGKASATWNQMESLQKNQVHLSR